MDQFNNITEFRQAVYDHGLAKAKDAQFELVDALLLSPPIRSFPELSLSPVFRRKWSSAYAAIEEGSQNVAWLEKYFVQQVPVTGVQIYALDGTAWAHPGAKAMSDRQYVYSPTIAVDGGSIVVGHPYSVLGWAPERHSSWTPSISVQRIKSEQTAVQVGAEQVKRLCKYRKDEKSEALDIIAADGKYGNHRFLAPLRDEPCGALVRLRRDRVLYGKPGPYGGRGRPRVHGERFAFKEPETWGEPATIIELQDEHWGQVRLRRWDGLHARADAETSFSVILVETHLEREKPSKPFWLAYQPPPHQQAGDQTVSDLWYWYQHRWPVEPSIRFRKQYLHWTLPRFHTPDRCDRWTMLTSLAQWQLFLARDVVKDKPLPWQPAQDKLTPERVLQSLGALFRQIDTPARAPQTRGKSPGWPQGRKRTRPDRHPVVKKSTKKTKVV
jgi:hypothetical protein